MRYSKIQYICWLFSGAEISLLKECPTDFNRQASIGFTIFMTCLLAGLSGGFAAWRFTIDTPGQDGNWIASIIFGLVWGMLVFSIDRSMVVTLKKNPTLKSQPFLIPLVTRMILAGLLAFMISIPLETKIFEPEIAKQALDDIQHAKLNYGTSVVATSGIGNVEARKKDAAELARIASEQISLEDSKIPGVPGLLTDASAQETIANRKDFEAQQQIKAVAKARAQTYIPPSIDPVTGEQKGNYFTSRGPAAKRYREAKAELNNSRNLANAARNQAVQLRAEARKKANEFRASADKSRSQAVDNSAFAEAERKKKQAKIDSTAAVYEKQVQKRGFVSEFVSMENAAHLKDNGSMLFFLWFIRILFFVIEILPTIVKLATPVGEYDHQLHAHEQMFALALRTNYKILEDRELIRQQTELNITNQLEQARQEKEIELGQKMLEHTANIQNSLAKQMLNDWHKLEKEKHRVASLPAQPVTTVYPPAPLNGSATINAHHAGVNTDVQISKNNGVPLQSSSAPTAPLLAQPVTINGNLGQGDSKVNAQLSSDLSTPFAQPVLPLSALPVNELTRKLFSGKKWRLQGNGPTQMFYFQNSGSTLNTLIHEYQDGLRQAGKWEHPHGDSNLLRIAIGNNEKEYRIAHVSDNDLQLVGSDGDQLNFKF